MNELVDYLEQRNDARRVPDPTHGCGRVVAFVDGGARDAVTATAPAP